MKERGNVLTLEGEYLNKGVYDFFVLGNFLAYNLDNQGCMQEIDKNFIKITPRLFSCSRSSMTSEVYQEGPPARTNWETVTDYEAMSELLKANIEDAPYFITLTTVGWVDAVRRFGV